MTTNSDMPTAREILPARSNLHLSFVLPGSKSVTNRALLLAALATGTSTLNAVLRADDTLAFADGLRSLGFSVGENPQGWILRGSGGRIPAAEAEVYCAEAGTAARFLLAACAAGQGRYHLDAAPQLRRRPLGLLLEALRSQGAQTDPLQADRLPLTLVAEGLDGGLLRLPGTTSSQFISALLMAAPLARASTTLEVEGLVSRPYVDMTIAMMDQFGIKTIRVDHRLFRVSPGMYQGRDYDVEPDASTASYFFAAAAVSRGRVKVKGLHRTGCLQGDVRFVDVLAAMGCSVIEEPDGLVVAGPASLAGLTVDMSDISDTFMTLAAVAPLASSPVTITGIANVRLKESDRITVMELNLRRLGVETESGPDFLRIHPGHPHGARIDTANDHRIAMSFAVLGLRVPGIVLENPGCVSKTCPAFFELWSEMEQRRDG